MVLMSYCEDKNNKSNQPLTHENPRNLHCNCTGDENEKLKYGNNDVTLPTQTTLYDHIANI